MTSRVNNNVDCESTESIGFMLNIWDIAIPVLVAGFNPQNVFKEVEETYWKWDVVCVFGRHFLANPDLPFRLKNDIDLNKYDRS